MSVTTNLGKVACVGKGEFNASARYDALDIVSYNGSSYLVIAPCLGIYPPNTSHYMLLASKGDTGARGERGLTGATGAKGEKGDTGTGLDIKGIYASLDALMAAVSSPEQGDMYFVGTAAPYTVYMWDTTSGIGAWISQGVLQGTKGDTGAVFTPNVTAAGVLSWTNNGDLTNPQSVNIKGPQGERGDVGVGFPAGGLAGQILSKATNNDYDGEWVSIGAADIGAAAETHEHSANDIAAGTIPVVRGGTGADTAEMALINLGGISITKVWENASVASEFNAQTLSIDLADYDMVLIRFRTPNNALDTGSVICEVGGCAGLSATTYTSSTLYYYYRAATITGTGIKFEDGWYNKSNSSTASNSGFACAPVSIYGIKGVN